MKFSILNAWRRREKMPEHIDPATPAPATPSPSFDDSDHLAAYLNYYRGRQSPGYAVLVTGDWGTGKTYQVRKALPKDEAYYVSLFGLASNDEVIFAVFAAMFPSRAKIHELAGRVTETTAEVPGLGALAVGGLASGIVGAFVRREVKTDKPIIFDDLERCGLNVKETLGIINLYVEQHKCAVIVIAHDEKLADGFSEAKEKIFGQTLKVAPKTSDALTAYLSAISNEIYRGIIASNRDRVSTIFGESGVRSLRILRHVVDDLERLLSVVTDLHRENEHAMAAAISLFTAFDIEWRAGRLNARDLHDRLARKQGYYRGQVSDHEAAPIRIAADRYSTVDLADTLLLDAALEEMFVFGRYTPATIRNSLDSSPFFVEQKESPAWLRVISFDDLEDDVVSAALVEMRDQITKYEVTDSGELLHIISLEMMMANRAVSESTVEDVERWALGYIRELKEANKLPAEEAGGDPWYETYETGAYGHAFWVNDSYKANFVRVFEFLVKARSDVLASTFPLIAQQLLVELATAPEAFAEKLTSTRSGKNAYAYVPVLTGSLPSKFVEAWMVAPKKNWRQIFRTLTQRYKNNEERLAAEKDWLAEVRDDLGSRAEKATGLAKLRLLRIIPPLPARWL
ncbi:MAG: hypothetical protein Q8M47_13235 [Devosia sp.]|nr:hypothetical protein [Devosia sp.]